MTHTTKSIVVILAGGKGERFWPKSRISRPKQTLAIGTQQPMLLEAVQRAKELVPEEHIYISTGSDMETPFRKLLKNNHVNYLLEPLPRDSAAAIGYACSILAEKYGRQGVVSFIGSDYLIQDEKSFGNHLRAAMKLATENDVIVTIGIQPTRPATSYGYLHMGKRLPDPIPTFEAYSVRAFKEKPNLEKAEEYFELREYLWNSGMFVCKLGVMLDEIRSHTPELSQALERMSKSEYSKETIAEEFKGLEKISIDFSVMEKTSNIVMLRGKFPWDDLGDWEAFSRINTKDSQNNVVSANWVGVRTHNTTVYSETKKLIGTIGIKDMIIVETEDAILICPKNEAQNVKKLVQEIAKTEYREFL
ncbi:MAG TPA: sugar phosphate nucleotidyltransferase [Candidatus Hodarchaeales archaeon]|nr:sugar phosphate nucleotidyltransferase [Candidatus Hodarchaeales archaeon]